MRALHRSLLVAGLAAPLALSLSPLAMAGESHDGGHHGHGDKKSHSKKHTEEAPSCGVEADGDRGDGPRGGGASDPGGLLAPVLSILSSTTESTQGITQDAAQTQDNSTDQSNSLVAPVVQVNPVILGEADNSVDVDSTQGNANATAQGQELCQAAAGGDQS